MIEVLRTLVAFFGLAGLCWWVTGVEGAPTLARLSMIAGFMWGGVAMTVLGGRRG